MHAHEQNVDSVDPNQSPGKTTIVWSRAVILTVLLCALVAGVILLVGAIFGKPTLTALSPEPVSLFGPSTLEEAIFVVESDSESLQAANWSLDGTDVTSQARVANGRAELAFEAIADGPHRLAVSSSGALPWSTATVAWTFTVDTTPPDIAFSPESLVAERDEAHQITGTVDPGATLTIAGRDITLTDGAFAIELAQPPQDALLFVAVDMAGNQSEELVRVATIPRAPDAPVRGVHVSAKAWADESLRSEILRLVEDDLINTVQLDLKDETGEVGYNSAVVLGHTIGATKSYYDLAAAVSMLHASGVRVIGRLVAFRDPILADWAWTNERWRQVVQTPDGQPYAAYGGFTNLANRRVRTYNIDIAEEAARIGVDDILFDYVRRPDGPIESMVFPGLDVDPEVALITFLEETEERLAPYRTFIGASVFGIAALRPQDVAQNVPDIADHVDYIAPMVYPSHWSAGVYDVEEPSLDPYAIVRRSLEDFVFKIEGRGARVLPWLQDFSLEVDYGPDEVRAQIEGARDAGIDEWLLWDPAVTYTSEALQRRP